MQGPREEGIDFFLVIEGSKKVIIGQAEAGKALDLKRTISRGIISKLRWALTALNDTELARNRLSPIATCIDAYNESVAKEYCVEFWVIIGGVPDKGLAKACKRFERVDLKLYPKHSLRICRAMSASCSSSFG